MATSYRDPSPWHDLQRELEEVLLRLIDAPELDEPWRRRARLTAQLLALARQEGAEQTPSA